MTTCGAYAKKKLHLSGYERTDPNLSTHATSGALTHRGRKKASASPWGAKNLNPTPRTPKFKACTWQTSPPKYLTLKISVSYPKTHNTVAIWVTTFLNGSHAGTHRAQGPTQGQQIPSELRGKEAGHLHSSDGLRTGVSFSTHVWEAAGTLSTGARPAPSWGSRACSEFLISAALTGQTRRQKWEE